MSVVTAGYATFCLPSWKHLFAVSRQQPEPVCAETMGAYRVLNNSQTTSDAVLAPHRQATIARVREHGSVVLIQETSELDFSKRRKIDPVVSGAGSR
jgi:hypothetical protein